MSRFYANRYRELLDELLFRREQVREGLSPQEEAQYAGALDSLWQKMTEDEQEEIERELSQDSSPPAAPEVLAIEDQVVATGTSDVPRKAA